MKKISTLFLGIIIISSAYAQTPKATIVEHFTNTVCGLCAVHNPNLFSNLANHPDVIHISYHPSSPYPSCEFNQVAPGANDGRVQHYNQYGSTPKIMVNGTELYTGSNFGNSQIIDDVAGQMSPFEINVEQTLVEDFGFLSEITVKTTEAHTLENLNVFIAIVQDTVFYNAPNGENVHINVMRHIHSSVSGAPHNFSQSVGDSVIFNYGYIWDTFTSQGFDPATFTTTVIIQDATTNEVHQAFQSEATFTYQTASGVGEYLSDYKIFPNPARDFLNLDINEGADIKILDLNGRLISSASLLPYEKINISALSTGTYLVEISVDEKRKVTKFIKY